MYKDRKAERQKDIKTERQKDRKTKISMPDIRDMPTKRPKWPPK